MSTLAIRAENLSKKYRIGASETYKTFREMLIDSVVAPFRRLKDIGKPIPKEEIIWALQDVSFEVKEGEVIGIIGRNGAGKTTLLKILSRITDPTKGRVTLNGRVASLLEVGTGFHPELTGHENIYLNGAILGMDRYEISRKFDEIVAFAEIEKFLNTPVKRYSSGMYMRLAFAVAAHLDPEILVIDEVLAVGDAAFQKKCLGKMEDVAQKGRTVLFVSHNMGAVETLCNRAYLIDHGQVVLSGETQNVVSSYLAKNYQQNGNPFSNCTHRGNGKIRITSFHMESSDGELIPNARSGAPVIFVFEFKNRCCDNKDLITFSFSVHTDREFGLFHYYSHFSDIYFKNLPSIGYFKCLIPELALAPGNYLVKCRAVINGNQSTGEEADWPSIFVPITVVGGDFYGTGNVKLSNWGPILVKGTWSMIGKEYRRELVASKFDINEKQGN